ncbi:bacillithiol biosynthesis cysteine-adding enzyme BshC [Cytobacillus gottheilii]|uniref:Putative cysteine ligase BshC n=1 Tax=Cytobacillus gottheilii TaxID=859144 RepID=A0ABX8FGM4_9BACI|nr:bacillithiol biosynthesis cysteine-adding enzyme BshC [Cytobacillus gottheilii]QVY63184.1 bacillithiol biosynthesis cysteine-adding enzyme BshC [Cytobacillus gottheilii]
MEMLNLSLPAANKFATEYIIQSDRISPYFDYRYNESQSYEKRIHELEGRSFMREELASYIEQFMGKFPASEQVGISLKKLQQNNSAVVIGGQQAGIMTGPLYSIHKVLSIVAFAKEKEKELQVPVVPVFWIAGEDHDYPEVNHIFTKSGAKMNKVVYPEKVLEKKMVSNIAFDQNICREWVDGILESYGETAFTKDVMIILDEAIQKSDTFVDLFAYIIMAMFKDTGLLLVDSGDRQFRQLQKEILKKQIRLSKEVTQSVFMQQENLKNAGISNSIDITAHAANLFYYDEKQHDRLLLEYHQESALFSDKEQTIQFSLEELLQVAEESPEKLSNNVVTRPITQELLFPTLAFIAGPGEIAYWAELQQAFRHFSIQMPPLVPRINFTLLERDIETDLNELEVRLEDVLANGIEEQKKAFLQSIQSDQADSLFASLQADVNKHYRCIEDYAKTDTKGVVQLLKKNEQKVIEHIQFLQQKIQEDIQLQHSHIINKYDRTGTALKPDGAPQERVWNALYFMNRYGLEFFQQILNHPLPFDGSHVVVKI